jgi:Alginate export
LKRYLCLLLLAQGWIHAESPAPFQDGSILAPVNGESPSWLRLSGEYRIRAEGYEGNAYTAGNNEGYLLSRFQLNMDVRFSWFRVFAQTQDARALGNDTIPAAFPYQDRFDLRQAFLELGNIEKDHFAVRAGRQELVLGDQRILGTANWLNTPRSFDAVRAVVSYRNIRVDAFSAAVVNPVEGSFDHSKAGNNLHGLYGTITHILPGATIEPYLFWHLGAGFRTEQGLAARRSTKTIAVRIARKPRDKLDYEAHLLRQFGSIGNDSVGAYAMNFDLGYTCSKARLHPRIYGDYAYASGDKNPLDGKINTFDQIYPSNHGLYGIVDLFGWQNLRDLKFGLEVKPFKKLTASTVFHNLNLANSHDALYNGIGNAVVRNAAGTAGTYIGNEWEGTGAYPFTKYLTSGIGYGRLFPGEFVKKATKGSSYNISYLFLTYAF